MAKTVRSSKDTPYLVILGTIWWKNHWIRQNLYQIQLDLTGSWTDPTRPCQFLSFFGGLRRVLASPETNAHPKENRLVKLNRLTGRLWVGHKLDLPDPWTALVLMPIRDHKCDPLIGVWGKT